MQETEMRPNLRRCEALQAASASPALPLRVHGNSYTSTKATPDVPPTPETWAV